MVRGGEGEKGRMGTKRRRKGRLGGMRKLTTGMKTEQENDK